MTVPARKTPFERALFAAITRGWHADRITNYETSIRVRDQAMSAEASHTFASIDAKATGLLTHTSMMIAGLGLLAPLVASNDFEIGIVVAEIGVYLLIAVGCLRCLSVFRTNEFAGDRACATEIVHHELIVRAELYSLCVRSAIVFTIVVFLLLPVLYLWTPGK
ncbi:MAG: hypothetical protein Q8M26_04865 [Pseudolabrys sp.]|nr:hypothetical protein [Pseudolabrys sp.]